MVELYSFFSYLECFVLWKYGSNSDFRIGKIANCGLVWSVQNETAKWFLDLLSLLFFKCWFSDGNQRMISFIFKI